VTAIALARAGAHVVATGRDEAGLQKVSTEIEAKAIRADLMDPADVERLVAEAGEIDILVNNAGLGWAGPFVEMSTQEIHTLVQTNLSAVVALTRALLPGMVQRRRGHVVNVASIAGHVGVRDEAVYSATKAALVGLSEALRYELHDAGVGISTVSPGPVDTAYFERRGRPYPRRRPRPVEPERVAEAILHAIRSNKGQVFVPRWMGFAAWIRGAAPPLYRMGARRFG
jgi:short-subunit dehydrogenase